MTDDIYEETLIEQADYLGLEVEELRKMFLRWLNKTYEQAKELPEYERAVSIGIYRIVKLKSACRMTRKSRELWRDRAMELGWGGDNNE